MTWEAFRCIVFIARRIAARYREANCRFDKRSLWPAAVRACQSCCIGNACLNLFLVSHMSYNFEQHLGQSTSSVLSRTICAIKWMFDGSCILAVLSHSGYQLYCQNLSELVKKNLWPWPRLPDLAGISRMTISDYHRAPEPMIPIDGFSEFITMDYEHLWTLMNYEPTIRLFIAMERSTMLFLERCLPSMGHLYHGYVSHNQMVH